MDLTQLPPKFQKGAAARLVRRYLEEEEREIREAMQRGWASDTSLDGMAHIPSDPAVRIYPYGFVSDLVTVIVRVEDDRMIQDYLVSPSGGIRTDLQGRFYK